MSKFNLTREEIIKCLAVIDSYVHLPYRIFNHASAGHNMEIVAQQMLEHVGLYGYEPHIEYVNLAEGTAGQISLNNNSDKKIYIKISKNREILRDSLLATIAHEICHKLLFTHHCYFPGMDDYNEKLTDIATIYAGFGILTLNGCSVTTKQGSRSEWTDEGLVTTTYTTTHFTGYLSEEQYLTAYLIVSFANNVPKDIYENGLNESRLSTLRKNSKLIRTCIKGTEFNDLLKELKLKLYSEDASSVRDIVLLETLLREIKGRVIQHQKSTIDTISDIEDFNGEIINPYEFLLTIDRDWDEENLFQKDIKKSLSVFRTRKLERNKQALNALLTITCPKCGYTKENALSEHKKLYIRCPKCKSVFYWDATSKKSWTEPFEALFAKMKNTKIKKYVIIVSIIIAAILGRIIYLSARETYAFKTAINEQNIDKCRAFVEQYPDSKRLPSMYETMSKIEQDFYQQKLNLEYEAIDYNDVCYYINTYPTGQYVTEVNDLKHRFEDKLAYEQAEKQNTSLAWNDYLDKYPNGEFIKDATKKYKDAIEREEQQKDHDDFSSAENLNTKESWQAYLSQHPNGQYTKEAKTALQVIEDYEYYANYSLSNGSLPYRSVYGSNYQADYGMSKVTVTAPKICDVVVTARHINSDKVKGHIYVRANRTASFYIPEGRYTISFYYGNGWYPKKKIVGKRGTIYGGFLSNETVGKDEDVYYPANQGYTYTLQVTYNGNFSTTPSNVYEMF